MPAAEDDQWAQAGEGCHERGGDEQDHASHQQDAAEVDQRQHHRQAIV
ncbi:hypothetical protein [Streptacidiphilus sp. P02-A3a]|nr:hypothetical protein [Streptacidiphilus sp. P02-A3a]